MTLAAPVAAFAQSPTGQGYGGDGNVQEDVAGIAGEGAAAGGTLPFTGADLLMLTLAAVLLLGVGLTMRRLSRSKA